MDLQIALLLGQDGIVNGAIYALLALALVLVFAVTRVIFIPQGEFVAYGALTLAAFQAGKTPGTLWLLLGAGVLVALIDTVMAVRAGSLGRLKRIALWDLALPAAIAGLVLWLEPGKLEEETDIVGSMSLVQGWAFLQHDYVGSCMEKIQSGVALFGYSCGEDRWTAAWTDSFHNGTRIMFSQGEHRGDLSRIDVFGAYPAPPGPDRGWRTMVELISTDHLVITHFNVTPDGEEAKAVEIDYRRG